MSGRGIQGNSDFAKTEQQAPLLFIALCSASLRKCDRCLCVVICKLLVFNAHFGRSRGNFNNSHFILFFF